jgi:MFS transporter, FSR family, fosmidomycin resistance protein
VPAIIPLAIAFGFALNGTSSVLTAAVAHFIPAHRRARGYGAYFTASLVSSALAPLAYGVLGDATNLTTVFAVMAACTAAILLPLLPIRSALLATD